MPLNIITEDANTQKDTPQDSLQVSICIHIVPALTHKPSKFTVCLLITANVTVSAGNIKTSVNILFDEGAQRLFITTQLAVELQFVPTEWVALSSLEKSYIQS